MIHSVTCSVCRYYAYGPRHEQVKRRDGWHHPACRKCSECSESSTRVGGMSDAVSALPTIALIGILAIGGYVLMSADDVSMQEDWNKKYRRKR